MIALLGSIRRDRRLHRSKQVNKGRGQINIAASYMNIRWKREKRKIRDSFISLSLLYFAPPLSSTESLRRVFPTIFLRRWCHLYRWFPPLLSLETDVNSGKAISPETSGLVSRPSDDVALNS